MPSFADNPVWTEDETTIAYIKTCQGTKAGDPLNPLYIERIGQHRLSAMELTNMTASGTGRRLLFPRGSGRDSHLVLEGRIRHSVLSSEGRLPQPFSTFSDIA